MPDTTTFPGADYYEIAVVQYQEKMHSDLPPTKLRGYVQLETAVVTGSHYALPGGKLGVDKPHFLGPTIVAQKDRPVRITFYNLLPTGAAATCSCRSTRPSWARARATWTCRTTRCRRPAATSWTTVRNPMCTRVPEGCEHDCFTDNRATLHLHGGNTPWISDGTPHQWITPAGESTTWPEGVSVAERARHDRCCRTAGRDDGCQTFYYTNQQSARLMFYHDHSWGITRLNVYAGEAAGYLITDPTEQKLVSKRRLIPRRPDPAGHPGPDVRAQRAAYDATSSQLRAGPDLGRDPLGRLRQPLVPPRLHAGAEPRRPERHERVRALDVRPVVLAARGDAKYGPIANPYYNMDPEGPDGIRD